MRPLALGKVLVNALGNGAEFANLVLFLIKGLHDTGYRGTFSCTTLLSSSYVRKTRVKIGNTLRMMKNSATARIRQNDEKRHGDVTADSGTTRSWKKISMTGARIAIRMSIWNAFCTFVVSVVRRVTMDAVENLSMFEKANVCTLSYISSRRFCRKADGRARGNARGEHAGRQLERASSSKTRRISRPPPYCRPRCRSR